MDFGEAIRAMKDGKWVARAGWNGKNMHIYLEDGYSQTIGDGVFKGKIRKYEPVICMFNAHGNHQPGCLANQPDILATDWEVVMPP